MAPSQNPSTVNPSHSSAREWLGFAGWVVVLCILAYGAAVFWNRLNYDQDAPGEPVPKTIVARGTGSKVESVAGPNAKTLRDIYRPGMSGGVRLPAVRRAPEPTYPFYTLEPEGRNGGYRRIGFSGQECINPYLERGIILSEDQSGYCL